MNVEESHTLIARDLHGNLRQDSLQEFTIYLTLDNVRVDAVITAVQDSEYLVVYSLSKPGVYTMTARFTDTLQETFDSQMQVTCLLSSAAPEYTVI